MSDILTHLHICTYMRRQMGNSHLKYACIEDFVLQHGVSCKVIPRPKNVVQMQQRMCYANAMKLASRRKTLTYVEGYATSIIPLMHAWCINPAGEVIDPTWESGLEYYGVPFNIKYVREQFQRNKYYSVLDDWKNSWPLLQGLDPEVWSAGGKAIYNDPQLPALLGASIRAGMGS